MTARTYRRTDVTILGVGYTEELELRIGTDIIRLHTDEARELWMKLGASLKDLKRMESCDD